MDGAVRIVMDDAAGGRRRGFARGRLLPAPALLGLLAVLCAGLCAMAAPGPARAASVAEPASAGTVVRVPVWALLDGQTEVSGGSVRVYPGSFREGRGTSETPKTPLRQSGGVSVERTNPSGVAMLEFRRLPRDFTVVVSGGRANGRRIRGFVSVQVHGYTRGRPRGGVRTGDIVYVNPVTTLIDAWRRVDPRVSTSRAKTRIYRALGIPQWADHADLRANNQWLDGRVLLDHVRVRGSLDRVTGDLLVTIRRGGRTIRFRAPRGRTGATTASADWWTNSDVGQLVAGGFDALGSSMFEAIASGGAGWILSQFLEAVGLNKFKDFLFPTQYMIQQLGAISKQLTVVQGLVEANIQATAQSRYSELAADAAPIVADIKGLMDRVHWLAAMEPTDTTMPGYNTDTIADIKQLMINKRNAVADLHAILVPPAPGAYGILQSASAYMGSRKPFFTPKSSAVVQGVFDYYQLAQLQLGILLTNYYSTQPTAYSPATIQETVIDKLTSNIAEQRQLVKPPVPDGHFLDLRTDDTKPTMLLWGPSRWVNGRALERTCEYEYQLKFFPTKFCDPLPDTPDPAAGFATEDQLKALLDGWTGDTPLAWLQDKTGFPITSAPASTPPDETGFFWVGPEHAAWIHCVYECGTQLSGNWYEWLHRYDFKDTSKPSPDAWWRLLDDLDSEKYNANAIDAPTPVEDGKYFWPVGG
jgi:hypothetical protein